MKNELFLRPARPEDGERVAEIYRYYVENTAVTFDYDPPTAAEFAEKIAHIMERYPFLLAFEGEELLGFAYASAFKAKAAYDWSVETTIYTRPGAGGQGVGSALYGELEALLLRQHVQNLNACITCPNPESEAFHQKWGYRVTAQFHRCGFKLGSWRDVIWMEKHLGGHETPPQPFIPYSQLEVIP